MILKVAYGSAVAVEKVVISFPVTCCILYKKKVMMPA